MQIIHPYPGQIQVRKRFAPDAEILHLFFGNATPSLIANTVVALAVAPMLSGQIAVAWLVVWCMAHVTINGGRYLLVRMWHQSPDRWSAADWERHATVGCALSGIAWGAAAGFMAVIASLPHQMLIVFALAGMTAGALSSMTVLRVTYPVFLLPALLPAILWFLTRNSGLLQVMGLLATLYLGLLLLTGRHLRATLIRAIHLADENEALAQNLARSRDATLEANAALQHQVLAHEHAETALRASELRLRAIFEAEPECVKVIGLDGRLIEMNAAGLAMLDAAHVDEVIGQPAMRFVSHEYQAAFKAYVERVMQGDTGSFEFESVGLLGTRRWLETSMRPLTLKDGSGNCLLGVTRDVSEHRRLSHELSWQSRHDALTGLMNRREFEVRLAHSVARARSLRTVDALLYLDLDQFKVVNDTVGHQAGDALLREVAATLPHHLRATDTLARLGGDEFGILLESCPIDRALGIAEDVAQAVAGLRFHWEGRVYQLNTSIGLVGIGADTDNAEAALVAADLACYAAKDLGRNQVYVHRTGDHDLARRRGEMHSVEQIQRALTEQRFVLHQQVIRPVSAARAGEPFHCEVLLRMRGEDGTLIPPGQFLPAAERYNLMPALDRWVVNTTLSWIAGLLKNPRQLPPSMVAINLSGPTLADEGMLEDVMASLHDHGVPGHMVCFEITETAAVTHLDKARRFMGALRERGCRFALDDFGSGLSSFGYLRQLPVDFLKIDGSFVRTLAEDPATRAIVAAINEVGHTLGLITIAEFVESAAILGVLREIGVDYAQGYAIACPEPLEAFGLPDSPDAQPRVTAAASQASVVPIQRMH